MASADWFIDLFTSEAEKLIELLRERAAGRPQGVESYWWIPGLPEPGDGAPVAAVDGGGGLQPLAMGWTLYIARAYGYVEGGEPERGLELRVYPVREPRVLDALRAWLEHRIAVRLVHRLPPGSILLMDGSLWATVTAAVRSVARLASNHVEGLGSVYTALHSIYLLMEVSTLARTASERGVLLAYVSKDHAFRALKEKILLEAAAEKAPVLRELVARALSYYPLANREELVLARRSVPREARPLYDAGLDPSYRDAAFLSDAAGQGAGYTWQLRLPPPRPLMQLLSRGGLPRLLEAAAERASLLLGDEPEASEFSELASRAPGILDQLPAVSMFYVRLSPGDQPLLVEVPGQPGGYYSTGRPLLEPDSRVERIVACLVRGYGGPDYYNIPLIAAHLNATMTGRQLEEYVTLLESLAAAQGVRLELARRYTMARRLGWSPHRRRRGLPF